MRTRLVIFTFASIIFVLSDLACRSSETSLWGDRIAVKTEDHAARSEVTAVFAPIGEDYPLGPGDILNIVVRGKTHLNYHVNPAAPEDATSAGINPDQTTVTPAGQVILPIVGPIQAAGKTTAELKASVSQALSEYFKDPEVNVAVAQPRMMKVFVNGSVVSPGAQVVPGTATVVEILLAAGIDPTGSTRRVELRRKSSTTKIDVFSIVTRGQLDANLVLEPGDVIYVPAVTQWVRVAGEVTRPGRYELLPDIRLKDLIDLAMGVTPAAVATKVFIERPSSDGQVVILRADAANACASPDCDDNIRLSSGDSVRVPSLAEYMSMVRMVGEFVGNGVYQRTMGQEKESVLNKSGVYLLAQGKTAGEVIRETGGVTPQADLKKARIQRRNGERNEEIVIDLENLLMKNDPSADVVLQNGDIIVLPALPDKVHVFGAVTKPGSYAFAPGKKLIDYVGDAGGQTPNGRLSHVRIIRGDPKHPVIQNCDLTKGVRDGGKNNPTLEPGDTVFIADGDFNGWRDMISMFTTLRLIQTVVN